MVGRADVLSGIFFISTLLLYRKSAIATTSMKGPSVSSMTHLARSCTLHIICTYMLAISVVYLHPSTLIYLRTPIITHTFGISGWLYFLLCVGSCLCAAVSKETGLTAAALCLLYEAFLLRKVRHYTWLQNLPYSQLLEDIIIKVHVYNGFLVPSFC